MVKRQIDMRKFTRYEKDAIERFLDEAAKIPRNALDALAAAKGQQDVTFVRQMRQYWRHVAGTIKMLHAQNKPKKRGSNHGPEGIDQSSAAVASGRGDDQGSETPSQHA